MAIVSPRLRLVYYDVTKVASTSMKLLLYEVETGRPHAVEPPLRGWRGRLAALMGRPTGGVPRLHAVPWLATTPFDPEAGRDAQTRDGAALHRLALVRDPIGRLQSAWRDKVHARQIAARPEEKAALEADGLPLDPSFGTLIDNLERYRAASRPVRLHTTPMAWHLGPDLGFFHSVHTLERIDVLMAFLSGRAGRPLTLPRENESAPAGRDAALTDAQIDRLREITAPDYALLGDLYDPDAAIAKLERKG